MSATCDTEAFAIDGRRISRNSADSGWRDVGCLSGSGADHASHPTPSRSIFESYLYKQTNKQADNQPADGH